MVYLLSESFIEKTKLKVIATSLFFFIFGMSILYTYVDTLDYRAFFGLVLLGLSWKKSQEYKHWKDQSDKEYLQVTSENITITDAKQRRNIKVNEVTKVDLQLIHGKVKSIILHRKSAGIIKIQGVDTMEKLTDQLKDIFDESKIQKVTRYHR